MTDQQAWVAVICEVAGWDCRLMGGRAAKLAQSIKSAGGTVEELRKRYGQADPHDGWHWYSDHWLGKRGDRPNDRWIRETWGAWKLATAVSSWATMTPAEASAMNAKLNPGRKLGA